MSEEDVEALLGKPHVVVDNFPVWQGEGVVICLGFVEDRLAMGVAAPGMMTEDGGEYLRKDESFLDRIRRLLHL